MKFGDCREIDIFDIGVGVDGDYVIVFDVEVVVNDMVDVSVVIVEFFVGKNDKDCIFLFFVVNEDGVIMEEL